MKSSCSVSNNSACSSGLHPRPKITGLSRVSLRTGDLENSCRFFTEFLGYDRVPSESGDASCATIRINERQTVGLLRTNSDDPLRLLSFTIETEDSAALRRYLESRGCEVFDSRGCDDRFRSDFCLSAPGGVVCEVVQRRPAEAVGPAPEDRRIARTMSHVGFMVPDPDEALAFYVGVLGFREVWRGGPDPAKVCWVRLGLPEGDETIELMLYEERPTRPEMGHMNHLCLEVPDVYAVRDRLQGRSLPAGCRPPSPVSVGINRKRQINYYDADGTRVEIMEERTVDGAAAPSSTGVLMRFLG